MSEISRQKRRPRAFESAMQMHLKIKEYFNAWEAQDRPLTIVGMALFLDIDKSTLYLYESGYYDSTEQEFSDTIKKAKMYIENAKWEGALTGKYDKSVAIFDLKVNHNAIEAQHDKYSQQQEILEWEEKEVDINKIDFSGLTNDELRTMAEFRRILQKTVDSN